MKKRRLIISIFLIIGFTKLYGQHDFGCIVSSNPWHLINYELHYDIELKLNKQTSLLIQPQYYFDERGRSGDFMTSSYVRKVGGGLGFEWRHYFNDLKENSTVHYFYAAKIDYRHYELAYGNNDTWWEDQHADFYTVINSAALKAFAGVQIEFAERLFFETFLGFGIKASILDKDENDLTENTFNSTLWDYGYTGSVIYTGIKIGVGLFKQEDK